MGLSVKDTSPSAVEIYDALARLVENQPLASSPRLRAFLNFVVECALTGKMDAIKEYTVGTQALGRPDDFDPSGDAIVRVEAGRLRKAMALYYEGRGSDDPIIITMPAGGYAPSFAMRVPEGAALPSSVSCQVFSIADERRAHIAEFRRGMAQFKESIVELKSTFAAAHAIMARSEMLVARSRGVVGAGSSDAGIASDDQAPA